MELSEFQLLPKQIRIYFTNCVLVDKKARQCALICDGNSDKESDKLQLVDLIKKYIPNIRIIYYGLHSFFVYHKDNLPPDLSTNKAIGTALDYIEPLSFEIEPRYGIIIIFKDDYEDVLQYGERMTYVVEDAIILEKVNKFAKALSHYIKSINVVYGYYDIMSPDTGVLHQLQIFN